MDGEKTEGHSGPLKILCVTTSFPNASGDPAGFFVYQLAEALSRQKTRVSVLTPGGIRWTPPWPQSLDVLRFRYAPRPWQILAQMPGGIPVALNQNRLNYLLLPPFMTAFAGHLATMVRKCDVILANWAICGAMAGWLGAFHKKGIITVLRGSDVKIENEDSSESFLLRAAFKRSQAVVCVGAKICEQLKKTVSAPEKLFHIPNGIHEQFFRLDLPEPAPMIRLLFVGSLIPRKGMDVLLKALAELRHLNLHLTVTGQGPLEQPLMDLSRTLGLKKTVTFQGAVSPGESMAKLMNQSHILVLPSHHEGRPNVVIEAMAAARPVIGSDIHGIRECLDQSGAGILFPDNDARALASAIQSLIDRPTQIAELGRKAREWVLSQGLTWDNTARRYMELIRRVTNMRHT
jgi:glycosyltransferase involved in cell wall biosynthesis